MRYKIIHKDNYDRDDHNSTEKAVTGLPALSKDAAEKIAGLVNDDQSIDADRFYVAVPVDYVLHEWEP